MSAAYLATLAIEGIQKYILSTSKLKEMIGGSAIINYIASPDFYDPLLAGLNLEKNTAFTPDAGKYIVAQANAGALRLIVFKRDLAENFLRSACQRLLANFPGLPFYSAISEFDWTDDQDGRKAYARARKEADDIIAARRNKGPAPAGAPLLPILRVSRLDGLPAAGGDKEFFSLPSAARRDREMLNRSARELRKIVKAPAGLELVWEDDLEKMLQDQEGRIALICMDGNDLGKLFGEMLGEGEAGGLSLSKSLSALKDFSDNIQKCNLEAFAFACQKIIDYELKLWARKNPDSAPEKLVMPLRPLVMGGDDITLIARADIALALVRAFTDKFMEIGGKYRLSLGVGMVVMPMSYPFAKAFPLAESLQDSAKKLTRSLAPGVRPSSLDYLVLTEDAENNMQAIRQRLYTSADGFLLTSKPLALGNGRLRKLIACGHDVLTGLPRSQIRAAWTSCRKGPEEVKIIWRNLRENISRNLGGRHENLLDPSRFEEIFPENFFSEAEGERPITALGDYLELERLLPKTEAERKLLFPFIGNNKDV